ncbi:ADP-ribosylglycohydrolase family protein [Saccharopolyspora hordei]|uniref:ADP-ribosylglycohydrolase n=1 Tax=Saccharopolyspora hordei TaxID=1838 RepID=A0A853APY6_9PSEU|nr:ADP-ribosylglycohydrolase family protein [Saccharopolyspora hordei]NYI82501.1 ADP-ribosylglycohydrolase [Saccharopolyspora hordei]
MTDARPPQPSWAERFRGAMLGGAVGDALGAGVRTMTTTEIQQWFGPRGVVDYLPVYGRRGAVTDITQLTVFTIEALLRARATGERSAVQTLEANHLAWLHTQGVPWAYAMSKYGPTQLSGWLLQRPELYSTRNPGGTALLGYGRLSHLPPWSQGDGSGNAVIPEDFSDCIPWSAPVALWSPDLRVVNEEARWAAALLTRKGDTLCTTQLHADVLAQLLHGQALWPAVESWEANRAFGFPHPHGALRIAHAAMFATRGGRRPTPAQLEVEIDNRSGPADLGIALAAVAATHTFADAVVMAVNHSGDSAVTGALAGQLAGAIYGPAGIPAQWLDELELRDVIETLCADATEAFAPPQQPQWAQRYAPGSRHLAGAPQLPGGPTVEGSAEQTTLIPAVPASDDTDTPPSGFAPAPPASGIGGPTFPPARSEAPVTDPSDTGPIPVPHLRSAEAETTAVFPAIDDREDTAPQPEVPTAPDGSAAESSAGPQPDAAPDEAVAREIAEQVVRESAAGPDERTAPEPVGRSADEEFPVGGGDEPSAGADLPEDVGIVDSGRFDVADAGVFADNGEVDGAADVRESIARFADGEFSGRNGDGPAVVDEPRGVDGETADSDRLEDGLSDVDGDGASPEPAHDELPEADVRAAEPIVDDEDDVPVGSGRHAESEAHQDEAASEPADDEPEEADDVRERVELPDAGATVPQVTEVPAVADHTDPGAADDDADLLEPVVPPVEREPVDLEPPARAPIDLAPLDAPTTEPDEPSDDGADDDGTAPADTDEPLTAGAGADEPLTAGAGADEPLEAAAAVDEPAGAGAAADEPVDEAAADDEPLDDEPEPAADELPADDTPDPALPDAPGPEAEPTGQDAPVGAHQRTSPPPIVRGGHAKADGPGDSAPSLTERVLGCFLGGALGDALGSDLEFMTAEAITARCGPDGPSGLREAYGVRGAITDDTQMTLFTAEGLIRGSIANRLLGSDDPLPEVQLAYQRWLHTQGVDWEAAAGPFLADHPAPDGWLVEVPGLFATRAPGKTVWRALARFGDGHPAGSFDERINDSKGCGGVMRAAPAALWSTDPAQVFRLAARTAALTHSHPAGYHSAGALAVIVQQALLGRGLDDGVWLALQVLETWEDHEETTAALRAAVDLAEAGVPTPQQVADRLGGGWVGEEALAIAVCAALTADSVEEALRIAVHHDGDSDSTGAICGNIVGALHGVAALPVDWLADLELRDVVEQVALDCVAEFGRGAFQPGSAAIEPPTSEDWNERYPVRLPWSAATEPVAAAAGPEFPRPKPAPRRINGVMHDELSEGEDA